MSLIFTDIMHDIKIILFTLTTLHLDTLFIWLLAIVIDPIHTTGLFLPRTENRADSNPRKF